ncbi:hypothetical protein [Streptomyces sp. NPDC048202]|uniref:hypothetical protein n=1 Tax=unclassified Streptomyces TaxID=2593676 RepID=UPI00372407B6
MSADKDTYPCRYVDMFPAGTVSRSAGIDGFRPARALASITHLDVAADPLGLDLVPLAHDPYVTCPGLGPVGAVPTIAPPGPRRSQPPETALAGPDMSRCAAVE